MDDEAGLQAGLAFVLTPQAQLAERARKRLTTARTPNAGGPSTTEYLAIYLDQAREITDGWLVKATQRRPPSAVARNLPSSIYRQVCEQGKLDFFESAT